MIEDWHDGIDKILLAPADGLVTLETVAGGIAHVLSNGQRLMIQRTSAGKITEADIALIGGGVLVIG